MIKDRSTFFPSLFCIFAVFVEVNFFTLLTLKSKQIELLSSTWWHFEDFFLLFLIVTDFNVFFTNVWSQISHKGETIFLSKMVCFQFRRADFAKIEKKTTWKFYCSQAIFSIGNQ